MAQVQKTLVIIKPDVPMPTRNEIVSEFVELELKIEDCIIIDEPPMEIINEHYKEHKGKPFFEPLCEFMTSGPLSVYVFSGEDAVNKARGSLGKVGESGLRGRYGTPIAKNAVHASDSEESAKREIALWFNKE